MKLMGMKGYLHWMAWMFKFSTSLSISCLLITAIFFIPTRNGAIINHSDPLAILLFIYLYGLAIVTFAFAVSAIFAHSKHSVGWLALIQSRARLLGLDSYKVKVAHARLQSVWFRS